MSNCSGLFVNFLQQRIRCLNGEIVRWQQNQALPKLLNQRRQKLITPRRRKRENTVKIDLYALMSRNLTQLRLQCFQRFAACLPGCECGAELFECDTHDGGKEKIKTEE